MQATLTAQILASFGVILAYNLLIQRPVIAVRAQAEMTVNQTDIEP